MDELREILGEGNKKEGKSGMGNELRRSAKAREAQALWPFWASVTLRPFFTPGWRGVATILVIARSG